MSDQRLPCAVVGLGQGLEDVYVTLNHPRLRLAAVCDTKPEPYDWITGASSLEDAGIDISSSPGHLHLVEAIRQSSGIAAVDYESEFDQLLGRDDILGIVLVVPDPLHEPYSIAALEAGKFVLCTKPMAVTTESAFRIAEAAVRHQRRYMLGFQISYSSFARTIMAIVERGEIGRPRQARFDYHRLPWRPMHMTKNGPVDGSILKEGTHWLDLIHRLNGSRPWIRVAGLSGRDRLGDELEFEDNGVVILDYEGGFRAAHTFSYFRRSTRTEDFLLVGEEGTVRGTFTQLVVESSAGERVIDVPAFELPAERHYGYVAMHDEFARMALDGIEPYSDWRVGLENMLTCHAAQVAVAENRMVTRDELAALDWRRRPELVGT